MLAAIRLLWITSTETVLHCAQRNSAPKAIWREGCEEVAPHDGQRRDTIECCDKLLLPWGTFGLTCRSGKDLAQGVGLTDLGPGSGIPNMEDGRIVH